MTNSPQLSRKNVFLLAAASASVLLAIVGYFGCRRSTTSVGPAGPDDVRSESLEKEQLFNYAVDNLNRLDRFNPEGMYPRVIDRLNELDRLDPAKAVTDDPLTKTWPEPEMLRQIVNRLNQWIRLQAPLEDWQLDPMVDALPAQFKQMQLVRDLPRREFSAYDGFALREAVWHRDVSTWARGDRLDDVERAEKLFDWTVRNIQLEADTSRRIPLFPWEVLFFGRGTAMERAWVFVLLARQQGLDAAVLAVAKQPPKMPSFDEDSPEPQPAETEAAPPATPAKLWPWVVGLLSEEETYLFDPTLGLPIPAPDGIRRDESGQLDIRPATLKQVVEDESLLRQLDVKGVPAYPVVAGDLKRVVALLEASPSWLARRMALLQSQLPADRQMIVSVSPTLQAERFKACRQISESLLWELPFATFLRRTQLDRNGIQRRLVELLPFCKMPSAVLYRGRVLYLGGEFTGPRGAISYYQQSRFSDRELVGIERTFATKIYENTRKSSPNLGRRQVLAIVQQQSQLEMLPFFRAKQNASYWLGLTAQQRTDHTAAIDWLAKRTLATYNGGPWKHGANYNLARCYEATGQSGKAIETYRADDASPAHHGSLLRAKWLERPSPGASK